jgi:hypothetical protein
MNAKEKVEALRMIDEGKYLAEEIIEVCKESGKDERVAATALAIAYGSICVLAEIPMHQSISMLMSIYKQTVVIKERDDGKLS